MAKGKGGSMVRVIVLVLVLLAAAAAFWYVKYGRATGGGIENTVVSGVLAGGTLDDVTKAFGVQPDEQPNPDAATSTAKIYLYTLPGARPDRQFVRVRVAANGKVLYTRFVDQAGNEIVVDKQ